MKKSQLRQIIKEELVKEMWENTSFDIIIRAWNEEEEGGTSTSMVQYAFNNLVSPPYEIKKDLNKFFRDLQKEITKRIK